MLWESDQKNLLEISGLLKEEKNNLGKNKIDACPSESRNEDWLPSGARRGAGTCKQ